MCGIFTLLNAKENAIDLAKVSEAFLKGQSRGPESSSLNTNYLKEYYAIIGFHRLAINGLNTTSDQPLIMDNIVLICNGEIYNYKQLFSSLYETKEHIKTNSDCEVIIHMYLKYGMEYTLRQLDGEFAFVLYDFRDKDLSKMYVSRDPVGVRPLFKSIGSWGYEGLVHGFASEMKQLHGLDLDSHITQFPPSTFEMYCLDSNKNIWTEKTRAEYTNFCFYKQPTYSDLEFYYHGIRSSFTEAVKKRVENCERPVACLLSGGLDSSLVASIVSKIYPKRLETYSIGLPGSEDLKNAKLVAKFINSNHTEIVISEEEFLDIIPKVIKVIESYDTTTVRASVGNFLVAEYISKHSEAKVILNGDGSDELMGGYLYFHAAPDDMSFDKECIHLLKNIHYFDALRSDRCISANGLEARTPFLDRGWMDYYLSIPKHIRNHNNSKSIEKYLIRNAFDDGTYLPKEILFRRKEAFSDGVSSSTRSWYEIIQEQMELLSLKGELGFFDDNENEFDLKGRHRPKSKEQLYYYSIFSKIYPRRSSIIPYYWMPNFVEATDASARTLDIYKNNLSTSYHTDLVNIFK